MQIQITGQHVEVTEALHDYVHEKLGRIRNHLDQATHVTVVLHVEKLDHLAEASMNVTGAQLHAEGKGENMYAAIDDVADKLDRQAIRHKEKTGDHHQQDGAAQKHEI